MNPKLTTNCFKVLETLYDNQINIGEQLYCPLGQNEIAMIVGCNRMTVNNSFKILKEDGYISLAKNKHYVLTEKGTDTIKKSKKIE